MVICTIVNDKVKKLADIANIRKLGYFDSPFQGFSPLNRSIFR